MTTAQTPGQAGAGLALAEVVARLRRAMRRAARAADPDNALSVAQLELLSCLAENPGSRPGQLAKLLRLAPNSVTTLVNGLTARDLVTRTSGGDDRRTVALQLTGTGEAAVGHWQETNAAILRAALASLHPGWQHLLTASLPALTELITAIDNLADQGSRPAEPAGPGSPPAAPARGGAGSRAGATPGARDSG